MPPAASCASGRHQPPVVSASSARVTEPPALAFFIASGESLVSLSAPFVVSGPEFVDCLPPLLPPQAAASKPSVIRPATALVVIRARYRIVTIPPSSPAAAGPVVQLVEPATAVTAVTSGL